MDKKSFKATVTHKDTSISVDAKDVTGYDLGLAGIILTAVVLIVYILRRNR